MSKDLPCKVALIVALASSTDCLLDKLVFCKSNACTLFCIFIACSFDKFCNDKPCCAAALASDTFCLFAKLAIPIAAYVCASCVAIGTALSIAACTMAAEAIELEPIPRVSIAAFAARMAPAAHAGVPLSKLFIRSDSWPCTVDSALTSPSIANANVPSETVNADILAATISLVSVDKPASTMAFDWAIWSSDITAGSGNSVRALTLVVWATIFLRLSDIEMLASIALRFLPLTSAICSLVTTKSVSFLARSIRSSLTPRVSSAIPSSRIVPVWASTSFERVSCVSASSPFNFSSAVSVISLPV